ncbi:MAG: hypothetical protein JXQ96_00280 [Cyclobacteriaceae bacterium]
MNKVQTSDNTISSADIDKIESYDPNGYVFFWNGNIYRAIYEKQRSHVEELFNCGLIKDLIKRRLIPHTDITNYSTNDCSLVLKHTKIPCHSLPFEWSFSMLQDAAKITLEVNHIARKYGYQTIDAHPFNILFHYNKPKFVDIGSFVKIETCYGKKSDGWRAFGEFQQSFYAPLKLWSRGYVFFARHSLHGNQISFNDFLILLRPLYRVFPPKLLKNFFYLYFSYKAFNTVHIDRFKQLVSVSTKREKIGNMIIALAHKNLLPFTFVNFEKLQNKTSKLQKQKIPSLWANYHSNIKPTERHEYILSSIQKLNIKTIFEFGGNAGFISQMISDIYDIEHIICSDYDDNAIDTLYKDLRKKQLRITPVLMDFRANISDNKFKAAQVRFKSEAVLALALTHHLILTQNLSLKFILERIKSFSNKYVFVEFMPQGLYSSNFDKLPLIPPWYTKNWFRSEFEKHFRLVDEAQLEDNRCLFIGEI